MATTTSISRAECVNRVLGAHGFTTFVTDQTRAQDLVALGAALDGAGQQLLTQVESPRWAEIAQILRALSSAVETVSVHCHEPSTLGLVFIRTPPKFDLAADHNFVEASGQWLEAIRERTAEFQLSDQAKSLAEQAVGAVTANPLLAGAAKLVLDFARFQGKVRAVTLENYRGFTPDSLEQWRKADLTVSTPGVWSQLWAWDHVPTMTTPDGNIHRGGGAEWNDAERHDFMPEFKSPASLSRSIQSLCPPNV